MAEDLFGIVANVVETDRILRRGAKVWVLRNHFPGFTVVGLSRSGRAVEKWVNITRLDNFRAKWVPVHLRSSVAPHLGTRAAMEVSASALSAAADRERAAHPHRREAVHAVRPS